MTRNIFISYSHDSDSHKSKVLKLADKLNKEGLNCDIDLYYQNPIEGWPKWIINMINKSDFVIIVFSRGYYEKLDRYFFESNIGKGVVFEMSYILQELYSNKTVNKKFIPIVFESKHEKYITKVFNPYTYYNLSSNEGYLMLYRHLTGQKLYTKPNKGEINYLGSMNDSENELFNTENSNIDIAVITDTAKIELTIDGDFDDFSYECKEKLLKSISILLEMDEIDINIKRIKRGSIKVLIELPIHKALELEEKISFGFLKVHNIIQAEIVLENSTIRQLKTLKQATAHDTSSLDKYLQEIGKVELISPMEEVVLARRVRAGDTEALSRLVKANLRFVVSVAKQYQNQGISLPDLINEGNLGLMKAAERFDETRGSKFISYAVWWIRQAILQSLAEQSRIAHLPVNKIGSISRINKAFARLEQEFEREPSSQEIADSLEMVTEDIKEALKSNERTLSMDTPISTVENNNMYEVLQSTDTPSQDRNLINESLAYEIERALSTLSPRESKILKMYFGLGIKHPYTLEEIGEELNLTRERVRQIKGKAIKKIKFTARSKILKKYLE
jgi:RNA polymerase primary sigma factor